tara:strand:+ start:783 stop:968 length:186 start_codon:yes stop_codon:yes gene_type:complete
MTPVTLARNNQVKFWSCQVYLNRMQPLQVATPKNGTFKERSGIGLSPTFRLYVHRGEDKTG